MATYILADIKIVVEAKNSIYTTKKRTYGYKTQKQTRNRTIQQKTNNGRRIIVHLKSNKNLNQHIGSKIHCTKKTRHTISGGRQLNLN